MSGGDRELVRSLARRVRVRAEAARVLGEAVRASGESLRRLRGRRASGRRLEAVGVGLLMIPDPLIVTYIAGAAALGLGKAYGRLFSRAGIEDLVREARRLRRELDEVLGGL